MADEKRSYANELKAGVTMDIVKNAVERSGYPLETTVAAILQGCGMEVREEWAYRDRETEKLRAIDIMATNRVLDEELHGSEVSVEVCLVVECKRSELPYVFFRTMTRRQATDFPLVAGIQHIEITDGIRTRLASPTEVLGMGQHPFVTEAAPICATFTKGEWRNAKAEQKAKREGAATSQDRNGWLELSGSEPFSAIVMPLVGAMDEASSYFSRFSRLFTIVLGVSVLDAPMLLADPREGQKLELCDWVRVVRRELEVDEGPGLPVFYTLDIVHVSFLERYMRQSVLPFAEAFAPRANHHHDVLSARRGRVPVIHEFSWEDVERDPPQPIITKRKFDFNDDDCPGRS